MALPQVRADSWPSEHGRGCTRARSGRGWPEHSEGDARGTWEPFQFSGEELKAGMAGLQLLCRGSQLDAAAELLALMDNKSAATSKERISPQGFTAPTSRGLCF